MPLHSYLKNFFSSERKYGSKDRKSIAAMCYYHYRLGFGENLMDVSDRILLGMYLCLFEPHPLLSALRPEWNETIMLTLQQKLLLVPSFYAANIFPFFDELSEPVEAGAFSLSFLIQPKLFVRIRPGHERSVLSKLDESLIPYELISETCIAVANGSKLHEVIEFDAEAIVQDYNSQNVGSLIELAFQGADCATCSVWDCCAASGGKSILAHDLKPSIELIVSDVRRSILHNLQQRFQRAGIVNYHSFIADLRNKNEPAYNIGDKQYDLIICDAPCSGSGTWSRTPEELYYFRKEEILRYAELQKTIVANVSDHLKPGGQLLYITCSVFKKENEEVLRYIEEKLHLDCVSSEILKGYAFQADTMYAALFKKPVV